VNVTAIIIPVYLLPDRGTELAEFTRQCIESIRAYDAEEPKRYTVLIVDNGSRVGVDFLLSMADVYIQNKTNEGYAKAVNLGLSYALDNGFEWLCVMNNDITLIDDWIATAQAAWEPLTGVVSSHLHDHDPEHKAGRQVATWGLMFGALWLTKADVVRRVGLLDEGYEFGYYEDKDYWLRVHLAGYDLIKAGWCHHVGNATSGKLANMNEFFFRNKRRFEEKWQIAQEQPS
jgi:GT2 family glycosyltransferase